MRHFFSKLRFDGQDHELLRMVEDVLSREASRLKFKELLNPYLHPHGIKEMAFYLDRYREYLAALKQIALRNQAAPTAATIQG